MLLQAVAVRFNYHENFAVPSPVAYETLLWDVMKNDAALFMGTDQVDAAWRLLMPLIYPITQNLKISLIFNLY